MFFQKVKKNRNPIKQSSRPKSLDLHTFCMHVSAFVSVCFVCGIPDDALSYILLYDCQIQSCSLCNRNADHLFMNFCSITALSIYQNFCSVNQFFKLLFRFMFLPFTLPRRSFSCGTEISIRQRAPSSQSDRLH